MERLEVANLNHYFGFTQVLKSINFTLEKGNAISIVGPSGGGKTTLLHLCAGLKDVMEGSVKNSFSTTAFAFQEPRLLPWKTTLENIALGLIARGEKKRVAVEKSQDIAIQFGLEKKDFEKYPKDLSGGMKQRVSFARALVLGPSLLFLDEPFSALDIGLKKELQEHLVEYLDGHGMSLLFITHDPMEAFRLSDEILLLKSDPGEIVKKFLVSEQKSRRGDEFVYAKMREFLMDGEVIGTFELEIK